MSAEWDIPPAIAAKSRAAGLAEAPEQTAVEIERVRTASKKRGVCRSGITAAKRYAQAVQL
jgi:hypothetical protein